MRRKFEALAGKHRFTIVRADQPFTDRTQSFGTSQVIGPYASVTSPTANETHFWAFVDLDSSNWFTATEPSKNLASSVSFQCSNFTISHTSYCSRGQYGQQVLHLQLEIAESYCWRKVVA
jgi:hypothetical protein